MPITQQMKMRRRRNVSRFGRQLQEKQTLKGIYGLREEQLKHYYRQALQSRSETGPLLIQMLELRLDNAVFRAGVAQTRAQARQMVSHGMFLVNGRKVDVPSQRLKTGDIVSIKESKRASALFDNFEKRMQNVRLPEWLQLDTSAYSFKVTAMPQPEETGIGVDIRAVVELFAR